MGQLVEDLFTSPIRAAVDHEIKEIIKTRVDDKVLQENLLYHFHFDEELKPTMEFSKRLRAYLCYLFAQESAIPFEATVPLATTLELLHNSTLAIDDIQDNSECRCGRDSLWKKIGIPSAINAAYFLGLFSLQYYQEKRREYNYYDYTMQITRFIERLLCGQQKDLDSGKIEKTVDNYYAIAWGKTGALMNMACLLGSMPYSYNEDHSRLISEFANSLAVCYQILDDLNDVKKGLPLDSSNIYYFVRNDNNMSKSQAIREIDRIMNVQMCNMTDCVQRLHISGVLRTKKVELFINKLFDTCDNGDEE